MFRQVFDAGIGRVRHVLLMHQLRMVIGSDHHSLRDISNSVGREWQTEVPPAVDGALAVKLMPVVVPKHHRTCINGHMMVFRTLPVVGYENMMVLGCTGEPETDEFGELVECPLNVIKRIKEIAWQNGIGSNATHM